MTTKEIWVLYSTLANKEEAVFIARALVEKHLAACVNLHENVTSIYRWQGDIQQEQEVALIAKTSKAQIPAAIALIKSLHSYEVPCIVAYPAPEGFVPFLQWVADETVS